MPGREPHVGATADPGHHGPGCAAHRPLRREPRVHGSLPAARQAALRGLAAAGRVEKALEPLRRRGDFAPERTSSALTGLGYSAGQVRSYQNGSTGVGFLIDAFPLCVEGTMDRNATEADAFGGYPDHTGCDRPSGGH